ncbi:MAG: zf-TFIIB domain-containing protein [Acidobacteriota bacterium]
MNGKKNFKASFNCPNCGAAAKPDRVVCVYCGSPIATRICPSCFGNVCVTMKHCPLCGTALADSKILERESPLKCPLCEKNLALAAVGKHSLHECLNCGGLWIDKTSFQDICRKEEEQQAVLHYRFKEPLEHRKNQKERKRAYIPCPECGTLMNHKSFSRGSGIVLDWCRNHGNWFDRQELQQIIAYIRNGGLKKSRERERMYLQEEKTRLRMKQFELAVRTNRMDSTGGGMLGFDQSGDSILRFLHDTFLD